MRVWYNPWAGANSPGGTNGPAGVRLAGPHIESLEDSMQINRTALISAALMLAVLALPASAQEATAAGCAPAADGAPITVSGAGRQQSAPFHLDGGAYRADWTYAKPVAVGTSIMMEGADASTSSYGVIVNGDPIGATSGQTFVYKLKPGSYYVSAQVAAPWSVTLTPITP
jgi:hypothetical protein